MKDRTKEFFSTAEAFCPEHASATSALLLPEEAGESIRRKRSPRPVAPTGSFLSCAYQLHTDIMSARKQLSILQKSIKFCYNFAVVSASTSLQDYRPKEFNDLTNKCKGELQRIEHALESLAQQHKNSSFSGSLLGFTGFTMGNELERHRQAILEWIRKQLMQDTDKLRECLFTRQKNDAIVRKKRNELGPTRIELPTSMLPTNPFIPMSHQAPITQVSSENDPKQQHVSIDIFQQQQTQALMLQNDNALLVDEERSAAMRAIESTIHEISQTFQQLANLVVEQGERIERIDQNLDLVNANLEAGHFQLQKYFRGMSSNRALMFKLFAVMIVFIVIYFGFLL